MTAMAAGHGYTALGDLLDTSVAEREHVDSLLSAKGSRALTIRGIPGTPAGPQPAHRTKTASFREEDI